MNSSKVESKIHQINDVKLKHLPQGLLVCGVLWGLITGIFFGDPQNGLDRDRDLHFNAAKFIVVSTILGSVIGLAMHWLIRNPKVRTFIMDATIVLIVVSPILLTLSGF